MEEIFASVNKLNKTARMSVSQQKLGQKIESNDGLINGRGQKL